MKNIIIILALSFYSYNVIAQDNTTFNLQQNFVIGSNNENFASNVITTNVTYMGGVSKYLQIGAGVGIGISSPRLFDSSDPNLKILYYRASNTIAMPLFVRARIELLQKPTTLFIDVDGGYVIASVYGVSNRVYNPFSAFAQFNIGGYLRHKNLKNLYVGLGLRFQGVNIQNVSLSWNSPGSDTVTENDLSSDNINFVSHTFVAPAINIGYCF